MENESQVLETTVESEDVKPTELNTPPVTAADGVVEPKQDEQPKTFTQAEVDALIQKRLLKEERRVHRRIEQQLREQKQAEVLKIEPKRDDFRDDEAFTQAQIDHRRDGEPSFCGQSHVTLLANVPVRRRRPVNPERFGQV